MTKDVEKRGCCSFLRGTRVDIRGGLPHYIQRYKIEEDKKTQSFIDGQLLNVL